jgi:hypothetical protein
LFRWERGRQGTGYWKLKLFSSTMLMVDMWLLWYAVGVGIPTHSDPIPGYKHYRLNLILWQARAGGHFLADWPILNCPRLKVFRSDHPHSVSRVERGVRVVLSVGLGWKER